MSHWPPSSGLSGDLSAFLPGDLLDDGALESSTLWKDSHPSDTAAVSALWSSAETIDIPSGDAAVVGGEISSADPYLRGLDGGGRAVPSWPPSNRAAGVLAGAIASGAAEDPQRPPGLVDGGDAVVPSMSASTAAEATTLDDANPLPSGEDLWAPPPAVWEAAAGDRAADSWGDLIGLSGTSAVTGVDSLAASCGLWEEGLPKGLVATAKDGGVPAFSAAPEFPAIATEAALIAAAPPPAVTPPDAATPSLAVQSSPAAVPMSAVKTTSPTVDAASPTVAVAAAAAAAVAPTVPTWADVSAVASAADAATAAANSMEFTAAQPFGATPLPPALGGALGKAMPEWFPPRIPPRIVRRAVALTASALLGVRHPRSQQRDATITAAVAAVAAAGASAAAPGTPPVVARGLGQMATVALPPLPRLPELPARQSEVSGRYFRSSAKAKRASAAPAPTVGPVAAAVTAAQLTCPPLPVARRGVTTKRLRRNGRFTRTP
ncbi:hypothetical protein MMPV_000289 [Pyropia vietnamensis]